MNSETRDGYKSMKSQKVFQKTQDVVYRIKKTQKETTKMLVENRFKENNSLFQRFRTVLRQIVRCF